MQHVVDWHIEALIFFLSIGARDRALHHWNVIQSL